MSNPFVNSPLSSNPFVNSQKRRCSHLCPPHLERCDLDTNEHGGCHEGDCRCEKCPTRPRTEEKWTDAYEEPTNRVFNAEDIKKAISPTLPPCENCESPNVLAVRRTDILYAVTACIDCNHRRQLTEAEYLREWPTKELS